MDQSQQPTPKEKLNNRIFFLVFFLLIAGAISFSYHRIFVAQNYQIISETSCEPSTDPDKACFVREEEVATTTDDGVEATTTETTYYRLISKKAAIISACQKTEEKIGCEEENFTCLDGEKKCSYEYCTDSNVPEEESCYSEEENGATEESAESEDTNEATTTPTSSVDEEEK